MKAENGTGSVYRRKDLKRRPWVAIAPTQYEVAKGKLVQKRYVIGYYEKQSEARQALLDFCAHPTDKLHITVASLHDEWAELSFRDKSENTKIAYNNAWKKCADIFDLKVKDVRAAQLQGLIDDLHEGGLGVSGLKNVKAVLCGVFEYALLNDIVQKNAANLIQLPQKSKTEAVAFSDLELRQIEQAAANGVPFADCVLILCYTGFRISEFLALTRFSFDRTSGTLTGGTKSDAGRNRVVPVHSKIRRYVEEWADKGGDALICKPDGTGYSVPHFRAYCYYSALEAVGVRMLSPHSCRHTFATLCNAADIRAEDIRAMMGHASFELTANTYIHQTPETLKRAIEKIG